MEIFAAVVAEGGFSAASRRLGVPLATVSRKVAGLEMHLGVQLLTRSTRRVALTEAGRGYYREVVRVLDDVGRMESEVADDHAKLRGTLKITSPVSFGHRHLAPVLAAFHADHRALCFDHVLTNRRLDYAEHGIDLGLKIGPLRDSSMRLVRIGDMRLITCASPGYLCRKGLPETPDALSAHDCAVYSPFGERAQWAFRERDGTALTVEIDPVYRADDADAIVQFACADGGIGRFYAYQVAEPLAAGTLRRLLGAYEMPLRAVSFQYPEVRMVSAKVRAFLDFAVPRLRKVLAEIDATALTPGVQA